MKKFIVSTLALLSLSSLHADAPASISATSAPNKSSLGGSIKVATPQKDLETAIRSSRDNDILVYGPNDSWYHIDGKALQQGTRVFVLGSGSLVSYFPKDTDNENLR